MKLLVFGGSGQLGFELLRRAQTLHFEVAAPVRSEVDILNTKDIAEAISLHKPQAIVNCAAYTAVDKAETEQELAFAINAEAPRAMAEAAKRVGSYLVHVSTDYVFDGSLGRPLREEDPTNPLNVYGASKLAGEQHLAKVLPDSSVVLRTASLHGQRGVNFVATMLKLFKERPKVSVVTDQIMSPTWAGWLAEVILDVVRLRPNGVFHASGKGAVSWFDFAQAISELSTPPTAVVLEPTTAAAFARPAKRPMYSAFDCGKLERLLGRPAFAWDQGLREHLRDIGALRL